MAFESNAHTQIEHDDLLLPPGATCVVLGASGSGKSRVSHTRALNRYTHYSAQSFSCAAEY